MKTVRVEGVRDYDEAAAVALAGSGFDSISHLVRVRTATRRIMQNGRVTGRRLRRLFVFA